MEGGSQRLVVRLKKRTSFKTHSSSGLVESDWRAMPPKMIKLLFPEAETGKVGKRLDRNAVAKLQGLTGIGTVKVPGPGLIRIRTLRNLFPCECFDVEHVDVCDHPTLCDEATTLDEKRWVQRRLCRILEKFWQTYK